MIDNTVHLLQDSARETFRKTGSWIFKTIILVKKKKDRKYIS